MTSRGEPSGDADLNISRHSVGLIRAILVIIFTSAIPAHAQYEVAEIPFYNTPEGTAALWGACISCTGITWS